MNLITKEDIAVYYPISKNLNDDRVDQYIQRAQDTNLQLVLSPELYYALTVAFPSMVSGDRFFKLFNGEPYKFSGSFERQFPGVKQLLCAYSYSLLVENNSMHVTRAGNTNKLDENSQPATGANNSYASSQSYSDAIKLEGQFYDWMMRKRGDYPEFQNSIPSKGSSINFTPVTKYWRSGMNSGRDGIGSNGFYRRVGGVLTWCNGDIIYQ